MSQTAYILGKAWDVTTNEHVWEFSRKGTMAKVVPLAAAATVEEAISFLDAQDLAKMEKERAASIAARQAAATPVARPSVPGTIRCDSCHRPTSPKMLMNASLGSVCPSCYAR